MAKDDGTGELIPRASTGIIEAHLVVRDGEVGLAEQDGHHER